MKILFVYIEFSNTFLSLKNAFKYITKNLPALSNANSGK